MAAAVTFALVFAATLMAIRTATHYLDDAWLPAVALPCGLMAGWHVKCLSISQRTQNMVLGTGEISMRTSQRTIVAVSIGLTAAFLAFSSPAREYAGDAYWTDSGSTVVRNGYGECYRTLEWGPGDGIPGCGMPESRKTTVPKAVPAPLPQPPERIVRTELDGEAFFRFDEAELTPSARRALDRLSARIGEGEEVQAVDISAHADRIGTEAYNLALSQRRGDAVKRYLRDRGIDGDRISVSGHGESQPRVQCGKSVGFDELIVCLAPNRRAEVTISITRHTTE